MQQTQIKDDAIRIQQLTASYADAQALLGTKPGDQPSATGAPGYGGPPRFSGYQPGAYPGRFGGPPGGAPNFAGPAATGGGTGADTSFYIDRLTQEDRSQDWELKLELVVVIDPPPAAPAP
jgi:hypothetical protein